MALLCSRRFLLWAISITMLVAIATAIASLTLTGAFSKSIDDPIPQQVNRDPEGYTLEHVTILHRHGLRAPAQLSNWSTADDYPMGIGFLTKKGKQGSAFVGRVFRRFYRDFLTYSPHEVWARSSTYKRCFETEHILLGTMYPPHGDWDFGFPVQPIAIIMVPQGNDVLIESCKAEVLPDFKHIHDETDEALVKDGFASAGDFMAWISEVSGYSSNNSSFYEPIIDALYAQKYNELPIPKWAESKWSSMDWAMRRLSYDYWINFIPYYGQYMGKTIAERMTAAANKSINERLSIMSYHDTTIQALMSALQLEYVRLYPSFLGALHFQLYKRKSDGERFVRTMYHQGFTTEGEYRKADELKLPDCSFPDCPVGKFVELIALQGSYNGDDKPKWLSV
ncbi:testicular acid phosphatase-like isoform X2 [Varroa jacobsoni]|uniref:2-phosphoxylose phosphatase 1 n=1 Tax=Varroa destructor TaxID=109461 RepID=A0A7M7JUA5_VARDE|nr:prostatic acid phosphatase-like isoform X3 [Varroa destructor]XP_022705076.1 testicular acid phosphatase-like isoform X2 [Varroa jacobsoni]